MKMATSCRRSIIPTTPGARCLSITGNMADTLGQQNPFRYRGYYYDSETQFYYLNSRYYDPEVGRFINADGYVSTGQNILGSNMFTYCGNNPVNRADAGGEFFFAALSLGTMIKIAGALLFTFAATAILTTPAVQQGISDAAVSIGTSISSAFSKSKSDEKEQSKSVPKDITKSKLNNNQAYFPVNPYEFNPKGLVRTEYAGTKNGKIIEWRDPNLDAKIFEWNENTLFSNGPHYHTMKVEWDGKHFGTHYYAGQAVPEPWNSIYF